MWQRENLHVLGWVGEIASFVRMLSTVVCFKVVKNRLHVEKSLKVYWHAYVSWMTNVAPYTDLRGFLHRSMLIQVARVFYAGLFSFKNFRRKRNI